MSYLGSRDRGSMAVEFVVAAPAFALLLLLVSAGGQWLNLTGDVGSAARDAARQASIARDYQQATENAQTAAQLDLGNTCAGGPHAQVNVYQNGMLMADGDFPQATDVEVVLSCQASLSAFRAVGFPVSQTFGDTAAAPLDPFVDRG
jgi:Flp pilus assembly protein TadG